MNIFAILVIVAVFKMESGAGEVQEAPNADIMSLIKHVIDRLDIMDERSERRFDVVNERLNTINQRYDDVDGKITKLGSQVQELIKESQFKQQEIQNNSKAIATVAEQTAHLLELTNANLNNISRDVREVKKAITEVPAGKTSSSPANSCSSINKHRFNLKNGRYWIEKNGVPIYEHCSMDETGIPPRNPGSCKEWKEHFPESASGLYNITIGEDSFPVYCEMDTDSGGWLMVGSAVVNSNEEAQEVDYDKIRDNDYRNLKDVTSGKFLLSGAGLNALYDIQPFHELRIDCWKKYHNRRVNIKIVGHDTVQFLLGKTERKRPQACGEFQRLSNDTSVIGQNCHWDEGDWWKGDDGYILTIYNRPMYLWSGGHWHSVNLYFWENALMCDDYYRDHPDNVGKWAFYIR